MKQWLLEIEKDNCTVFTGVVLINEPNSLVGRTYGKHKIDYLRIIDFQSLYILARAA